MKTTLPILLGFLSAASASAEFRTWTRNDGKTAELELLSVTETEGEKAGEFKMRSGRSVVIKSSVLSEADAKLLEEWKPEAAAAPEAASVFDFQKPKKYYVFYYTASWCGPCQQFTPSLVEFYEKNKNDNFELVLITSDKEEESMEEYAVSKKMPWPQLKLKKAQDFKDKFQHGVRGIPAVIVCDLEGKIITANGRDLNSLGDLLK
ncbi:MAG: thioredoxin domain-containing protein [Akkermansiaceae bacterium]|nr:thioredoxin domain-containing protein [Akkermansiaceae bacterium]